jgi:hypothetical protein
MKLTYSNVAFLRFSGEDFRNPAFRGAEEKWIQGKEREEMDEKSGEEGEERKGRSVPPPLISQFNHCT